ncbi:biotin transporter BioY [Tardiphaga sp. 804_B3_N1_9]|uniref:biotin transporter BioY n=1 Tax=Tardiphaga TaxID=1395974 RepID=UPI003B8A81E8
MSDASTANARRVPIAGVWWPSRRRGFAVLRRAVVLAAFGVALLAVSAKINLPLPYVPMTLQTLVVLMIGAVYGWRLGTLTIIAYLAVGALGLPVFAGPVGGLKPLTGATAGFLSGFVVAAFVTGWFSERGWDRSMVRLFVAMAIGHIVIMAMGFVWLAYGMKLGAEKAWLVGVMPFLAGALVKNTLGAILVPVLRGMVDRRYR